MKKKLARAVGASLLTLGAFSAQAANDWSAIGTTVEAEVAAVLPVALPIMGAIIAVMVGKKVLKSIAAG